MSILIDKLTDYGCHVKEAMSRFLDNEAFYEKCFYKFVDDKSFNKLAEAVAAGDTRACFEAAHDLKGTSANMGITPINELVVKIVEEFRKGNIPDDIQESLAKLESMRQDLKKL